MIIINNTPKYLFLLRKVVFLEIDSGASYELKAAVIQETEEMAIFLFKKMGYEYHSSFYSIESVPAWNLEETMFDINEEL